ncbi:hypothetical protein Pdw03_0507 [Penicillium digitatum]|uniref:Uncharacterized protein n=1 Tax=Penicillium digitatum TaxID=36651 RepID=A0A7T6XQX9_PENDI|nr:hypothetical protein Pdw03_0507 [Penicillium digitatum]
MLTSLQILTDVPQPIFRTNFVGEGSALIDWRSGKARSTKNSRAQWRGGSTTDTTRIVSRTSAKDPHPPEQVQARCSAQGFVQGIPIACSVVPFKSLISLFRKRDRLGLYIWKLVVLTPLPSLRYLYRITEGLASVLLFKAVSIDQCRAKLYLLRWA